MLWTSNNQYLNDPFETEAALEAAVAEVAPALFGPDRIYLEVKRLIGAKGKTKNIPDGYLIDLTSRKKPRLFVVENELASHDPLNHVATQILEFSLSFETSQFKVKGILKDALKADETARKRCESYAATNGYDSLDHLLESLIYRDDAFSALVIIDALEEELETVLLKRFKFPVEVLTLRRFKSEQGGTAFEFEPFLAELAGPIMETAALAAPRGGEVDPSEFDTVVVPAQEEGFQETFIGENRWYQIRIHTSMIPRIKYVAAYRTAPVSAITHIAAVKNIDRWSGGKKYVLNFAEPAKEIGPIQLVPKPLGTVKAPQAPRYTSYSRLMKAANLDDAF
jgi:hypothetical protein